MRMPLRVVVAAVGSAVSTSGCFIGGIVPPPDAYDSALMVKTKSLPDWQRAYEHGRYDLAIAALTSSIHFDEQHRRSTWVLALGKAQMLSGRFERAVSSFSFFEALLSDPRNPPYVPVAGQITRYMSVCRYFEREARLLALLEHEQPPRPAVVLFDAYLRVIDSARATLDAAAQTEEPGEFVRITRALLQATSYPSTFTFSQEFRRHASNILEEALRGLHLCCPAEYKQFLSMHNAALRAAGVSPWIVAQGDPSGAGSPKREQSLNDPFLKRERAGREAPAVD